MFLNKVSNIFLNITATSRLIYNLSLVLFVFFLGAFLSDSESSNIFKILATIKTGASIISFGFGSSILKPLNHMADNERKLVVIHIVYVKAFLVAILSILIYQTGLINQSDLLEIIVDKSLQLLL